MKLVSFIIPLSLLRIPIFPDVNRYFFGISKTEVINICKKNENVLNGISINKNIIEYNSIGNYDSLFLYCHFDLNFIKNRLNKVVIRMEVPNLQTDSTVSLRLFNYIKNKLRTPMIGKPNYEENDVGCYNSIWIYQNYYSEYKIKLNLKIIKNGNKFYCVEEYERVPSF